MWKGTRPKTFLEAISEESSLRVGYRFGNIDAKKIGNASRYANCGWPNAIPNDFIFKGSPRVVLWALDKDGIKKGEQIHFIYNISYAPLVFGVQKLLGSSKMRAHFSKSLSFRIEEWKQAKQHENKEALMTVSALKVIFFSL